jgi:hypothetical protein
MITAIYARKSTEQNVSENAKSVTRQVEQARAFAIERGWTTARKALLLQSAVAGLIASHEVEPQLACALDELAGRDRRRPRRDREADWL